MIMNLEDFVRKFADQFEETPNEEFSKDTEFKALDEWDSMSALTIIAMADEEYNVTIKAEDIRNAETINDLADIIKLRML
jgi:acyl carrier protein